MNTLSIPSYRLAKATAAELQSYGLDAKVEIISNGTKAAWFQILSESASIEELRMAYEDAVSKLF